MTAKRRWWICLAVACLCLAFAAGCGNEKDKGTNRNLDRPTTKI
jgi:hypothetical protein